MRILEMIFGIFALLGAVDRMTGNHLKIGEEFEKGIASVAPLALSMVGMIAIAPTLAKVLIPVFAPVASWLHIDPSFIGGFIANDMGGASVAGELASVSAWGAYNGLVVASMLGVTICFTIPVALEMIDRKYHKDVLSGILCGVATIPVGCVISGLFLGFPIGELLLNLLPSILVSLVTALGIVLNPEACRKVFGIVGKIVLVLVTAGLGAGVFTHITGIVLIPYMAPVGEGFKVVGEIAILLAGVFPLIAVVSRLFRKPFQALGSRMGMNDVAVLGLLSSLANSIPMFSMVEKMNRKGIMVNMAFAVSSAFVFGDHLAFTMAYDEGYVLGMIIGKIIAGLAAVIAAHILYKHKKGEASDDAV